MGAGRGRVVKAESVRGAATRVAWEPQAPAQPGPASEVEVVREKGVVVGITVRCKCGRTHELELVPTQPETGTR
jgi:hypothetical protein